MNKKIADSPSQSSVVMPFQPRASAGRDRLLRAADGTIQRLRSPTAVLLHRWRSPRKPGPFIADASIARLGERVSLPGAIGLLEVVL